MSDQYSCSPVLVEYAALCTSTQTCRGKLQVALNVKTEVVPSHLLKAILFHGKTRVLLILILTLSEKSLSGKKLLHNSVCSMLDSREIVGTPLPKTGSWGLGGTTEKSA